MSKLIGWHECAYCHTIFPAQGFGFMSIIKHQWFCNQQCYRKYLEDQQYERKNNRHANEKEVHA